jgi:DNA-binding Lrp family transcriptional regulator
MTAAYIMVKSSPGAESDISTKIKKINGVKTVHTITGPYDLIVYVEEEDLDLLGKTVISKIQNLKGITDTMTCIVVDPYLISL